MPGGHRAMEALATAARGNGWPGVGGWAAAHPDRAAVGHDDQLGSGMAGGDPGQRPVHPLVHGSHALAAGRLVEGVVPQDVEYVVRHPAVRARWPAHLFSFERAKRLLPQVRVNFQRQPKQVGNDPAGLGGPGQVARHDQGGSGGLPGENLGRPGRPARAPSR